MLVGKRDLLLASFLYFIGHFIYLVSNPNTSKVSILEVNTLEAALDSLLLAV